MKSATRWWWVYGAAAAAAILPLPPGLVERWYSQRFYAVLQRAVTSASNLVPFALFDGLCLALVAAFAVGAYRSIRALGWRRGPLRSVVRLVRAAAILYLAFLALWGLNYRRVPLVRKVAFDRARVTRAAADALASRTVVSLNRLYASAHRRPTPLGDLAGAFEEAHAALQGRHPIVPGRPKDTLLGGYFHAASLSGMTDPFFLETLLSPDLLDVEQPFVIAHEWGHLAGYADESEASFVAWTACMRSDDAAQYSAWLSLLGSVEAFLPRGRRVQGLDGGPRSDLAAISARYARTSPLLRAAARESYDRYLKANGIEEGIASYDAVVELILGTTR